MLKHYIRIAIRNLAKQKALTFINVVGLSVGLACCCLFLLYAIHEFGFDKFHVHGPQIYRVNEMWASDQEHEQGMAGPYIPLGPAIKKEFPDVEEYIRISNKDYKEVSVDDHLTRQPVTFADPAFFSVFSFPLLKGNPAAALEDPSYMVLTRDVAMQLFGSIDIVGKPLAIHEDSTVEIFTVSGVAENVPAQSSIQFSMMGSFAYLMEGDRKTAINNWHRMYGDQTYVQLHKDSRLAEEPARLLAFRHKYFPEELSAFKKKGKKRPEARFTLQPLADLHTTPNVEGGATIDPRNIWILLGIAAGIMLIASINFTTLSIARSAGRAREVGVRKVMGGKRGQLVRQFLSESLLLTLVSALLGLLLARLLLPFFNRLSDTDLHLSFTENPPLIGMFLGLIVLVGLLAGYYPALVLSRFNAVEVMKNKVKLGGANIFTRVLVTFQFVLSIGLITCTSIMLRQVSYLRDKDLGLVKENVIVVRADDAKTVKAYDLFSQSLSSHPEITGVAASELGLGEGAGAMNDLFDFDGKKDALIVYPVDAAYLKVLGIHLLAGRNFSRDRLQDTTDGVILNETALKKELGVTPQEAIGRQFQDRGHTHTKTIIGVVRDFNFEPLKRLVRGQLFYMPANFHPTRWFVRVRAGDPSPAIAAINHAWQTAVPDIAFRYSFLDEDLDRFYKAEIRWRNIIGWAGGISIFLACLGLFGLAALAAANRVKEIGIRKILGASVLSIIQLLMTGFLQLVLLASLIAAPIAGTIMNGWLRNFAYRIDMGWWVFALTALIAIVIAALTIGVQTFRAAVANPVNNLRTE